MFCFYVRNIALKTKRTNPKRIMQLQVCASKNPQLKNILHLNNTKMPLRQRWAFWCILFLAAHNNSRRYAEKNFNTVFYTGNLSRFPIEIEMGNFPIHGENLEQEIPFLGGFWVFTGKEGLLFFYIPILGICCECFPKLFPKLGTIWEHFRSHSQQGELWGNISPSYSQSCE